MTERSYRGLLWTLALLALLADQGSKYSVFAALYPYHSTLPAFYDQSEGHYVLVKDAFQLLAQFTGQADTGDHWLSPLRTWGGEVQPRVNHGALFGMASERGYLANRIFAVISLCAAGAILCWSASRSLTQDGLLCTALGLILGGTVGNLYDRLVFGGVRDFLRWHYAFEWPVFNIADCCLVVGAGLLLLQAVLAKPAPEPTPAETAETAQVS